MDCDTCGNINIPEPPTGSHKPDLENAPKPPVPTYLAHSIIVTIFCCWVFGIPAIVYAAKVNARLAANDYEGAVASSKTARMWCWIAFGTWCLFVGVYLLIVLAGLILPLLVAGGAAAASAASH